MPANTASSASCTSPSLMPSPLASFHSVYHFTFTQEGHYVITNKPTRTEIGRAPCPNDLPS